MNPEIPQEQSLEELVEAYEVVSKGMTDGLEKSSNIERGKRQEEIFKQIAAKMPGENEVEKEGAAADYIEQLQQQDASNSEQLAA